MPLSTTAEAPARAAATAPAAGQVASSQLPYSLPDLVCFAHLHWDFVWQRPQHLMTRFAQHGRVFYVEDAFYHADDLVEPHIEVKKRQNGVQVLVVHLPQRLHGQEAADRTEYEVLSRFFAANKLTNYAFWYYTPMALNKSRQFRPALTVYDCMDELAQFKFAPPELRQREQELFQKADLVFTGGQRIYESKREQHPDAHSFPSSIDKAHFGQARQAQLAEPADQASIAHPRIGFFGVVDERLDINLLCQLATNHPQWQFVIIGPVVKIDFATLPQNENIHYLGGKDYQELPAYLHGWDVATLLFARNESTEFISPTKTPEYLAAGRPVVSTSIRDVVRPYGELNLVQIADDPRAFGQAITRALKQGQDADWRTRTDAYLATISWDLTWQNMVNLMQNRLDIKQFSQVAKTVSA
ncbi:MAG: glycosyltransferase family 1 protein [Janthinobacterium lividum]